VDIFIIAYDVSEKTDERRAKLRDAIKTKFAKYHPHIEQSVFLVAANNWTSEEVRNALKPYLNDGDRLFVSRLQEAAWSGEGGLLKAWWDARRNE
jgi:CRISPR/Cas system-associated endoribonuclease Cas2